jgi:hypothetical protein
MAYQHHSDDEGVSLCQSCWDALQLETFQKTFPELLKMANEMEQFAQEVSLPPYSDSNLKSLLSTYQQRASIVLAKFQKWKDENL